MATATKRKKSTRVSGSQLFEAVGTKVNLKKKIVRDTVYALVEVVVEQLTKNHEVRIPRLGKLYLKFYQAKSLPAGNYLNAFKRGADGKPVMEYREARVRPAKTKLKFNVAGQIRKPVLNLGTK